MLIALTDEDLLVEAVELAAAKMALVAGVCPAVTATVEHEAGRIQPVFTATRAAVDKLGERGVLAIIRQVWADVKVELGVRREGNRVRRRGSAKESK